MVNSSNDYMRCFVYSLTQAEERRKLEAGMRAGKVVFPKVRVNGVYKEYTEIVKNMNQVRYSDSKLIVKQDIRSAILKDT